MSTYRAQIRVEDGMLHTARPLTAPEAVGTMIDGLVYAMRDGGEVLSVQLTVETATDSGTPLGDSIAATSSAPVNGGAHSGDDTSDVELPATATVAAP